MLKNNTIYTPYAHACLPGITRGSVIELCQKNNIPIEEADLTLSQFMNADAVFATGTMGELTPIVEIDGREISKENKLLKEVMELFKTNVRSLCEPLD